MGPLPFKCPWRLPTIKDGAVLCWKLRVFEQCFLIQQLLFNLLKMLLPDPRNQILVLAARMPATHSISTSTAVVTITLWHFVLVLVFPLQSPMCNPLPNELSLLKVCSPEIHSVNTVLKVHQSIFSYWFSKKQVDACLNCCHWLWNIYQWFLECYHVAIKPWSNTGASWTGNTCPPWCLQDAKTGHQSKNKF